MEHNVEHIMLPYNMSINVIKNRPKQDNAKQTEVYQQRRAAKWVIHL